ncbi:hypothetical protein E2C01_082334 [Portunus trituberculatus]|uniref:Uncharacterized protein n=1 Tax=Portunus trituberculatus TaxID=210409 RepID=A0A5B7IU97_PORTR|nr:hypothetical protein [Portunus trituberculatus]
MYQALIDTTLLIGNDYYHLDAIPSVSLMHYGGNTCQSAWHFLYICYLITNLELLFIGMHKGGGGVVDKVVSVGSGRRPRVGSNLTTYRFEAMPSVEWFRITYMSPRFEDALGW